MHGCVHTNARSNTKASVLLHRYTFIWQRSWGWASNNRGLISRWHIFCVGKNLLRGASQNILKDFFLSMHHYRQWQMSRIRESATSFVNSSRQSAKKAIKDVHIHTWMVSLHQSTYFEICHAVSRFVKIVVKRRNPSTRLQLCQWIVHGLIHLLATPLTVPLQLALGRPRNVFTPWVCPWAARVQCILQVFPFNPPWKCCRCVPNTLC